MARYLIMLLPLAALMAWGAGCRPSSTAALDEKERSDPAIQAAWEAYEAGDLAGSEAKYEAIIAAQPGNARAHLDLAMVLMRVEEKPIKAIYHFMRYQELRPDSEKDELIQRNIRQLTVSLSQKASRSRIAQLEQQVALLQAELDTLRRGGGFAVATAPIMPPAAPAVLAPAAPPAPPAAVRGPFVPKGPRLYTVQPGDSLSRIAQLMYGDGEKSEKIYDANRGKLKNRNALYAGQVLVIPP